MKPVTIFLASLALTGLVVSTHAVASDYAYRVASKGIKSELTPPGAPTPSPVVESATWIRADNPANVTVSEDGLTATVPGFYLARASVGKSEGTWYWEVVPTTAQSQPGAGVATLAATSYYGSGVYTIYGGGYYCDGGCNGSYAWADFASGATLGFAVDATNHKLHFYVNGTYRQTVTIPSGTIYPAVGGPHSAAYHARFEASSWTYVPPAGYLPLR